ncbi:FKBP-type peptidyl-prolyl cis-trans isomerase [bacterium]|nr:FKBP-type peptidyl-prolyl cis-trans isomerase [bacterium]
MRYSGLAALVLVSAGALALRAEDQPPPPVLDTVEKKVGYVLGMRIGADLARQGATTIDVDAFARGLKDAMAGIAPVLSDAAMTQALVDYQEALRAKAAKAHIEQAKKNREEGAAFLEKNKTADGVSVTPSGLQYKVVTRGTGKKPTAQDAVVVNYEGKLLDGTVFDSSYKRGEPLTFGVSEVIRGWTEGLQLMETGSTFMLYIPSDMAYGENPPPGVIGPNAVLVFKVELIEIKKR